jgi:hypothetical protein
MEEATTNVEHNPCDAGAGRSPARILAVRRSEWERDRAADAAEVRRAALRSRLTARVR